MNGENGIDEDAAQAGIGSRLLVGGSFKSWGLICAILAAVFFAGVGALLYDPARPKTLNGFYVGGFFAAVSLLLAARLLLKRRWIEVTRDGLVVDDRGGRREFADDRIRRMTHAVQVDFGQGVRTGYWRRVELVFAGDLKDKKVPFSYYVKDEGGVDLFEGYLDRVSESLYEKLKAELAAGRSVKGDKCELTASELKVETEDGVRSCPVAELGSVASHDGNICVWRHGAEEPILRLPEVSSNGFIIGRLIDELVPEREESTEPPREGLGRVLFERTEGGLRGCLLIGAGIGLIMAVGSYSEGQYTITAMGAFIAVAAAAGALLSRKAIFRCQEWGVCRSKGDKQERIIYADLDSFTYAGTRNFTNGVYTGTTLNLTFVAKPEAGGGRIAYSASVQGDDMEIEQLRDHIAGVIASRMATEFNEGLEVPWIPSIRFLPGRGLEFTESGMLGKKDPCIIPFEEVSGFNMEEGVFHLWVEGNDKSVINEAVNQPNFFPGHALLESIFAPDDDEEEGEESEEPSEEEEDDVE